MIKRTFSLAFAAAIVAASASAAAGATPAAGAVGAIAPLASWQGRAYDGTVTSKLADCRVQDPSPCDHFDLDVQLTSDYWTTHKGAALVSISWPDASDNFDLWIFNGAGERVAVSRTKGTKAEQVFVWSAAGHYDVVVVPRSVINSGYFGRVAMVQVPHALPPRSGGSISTSKLSFVYNVDRTSWWWSQQLEATGMDEALRVFNPQRLETLPVGSLSGAPAMRSAIFFDLGKRGVTKTSKITAFTLSIAETSATVSGHEEQQEYNVDGKPISACKITGSWAAGAAELWNEQPSFTSQGCVAGVRSGTGDNHRWSFNLTSFAQAWAKDLSTNHGVMLLGGPVSQSWQANLSIPAPDQPSTSVNEYDRTKDRVALKLTVAPEPTPTPTHSPSPSPSPSPTPSPTSTGTFGGGDYSGNTGGFGNPGGPTYTGIGGGGLPTTTPPIPPASTLPPSAPGAEAAGPTPTAAVPPIPWFAWLVIPLGLLITGAIRGLAFDPVTVTTPDLGVVAALQQRNALPGVPPARPAPQPGPRRPRLPMVPPAGILWQLSGASVRGVRRLSEASVGGVRRLFGRRGPSGPAG